MEDIPIGGKVSNGGTYPGLKLYLDYGLVAETCNNEYGNYLFVFDSTKYDNGAHKIGIKLTNEDGYDYTEWFDVYINNSKSQALEYTVDTLSDGAILTGKVCNISGKVIRGGTYPGLKLYLDYGLVAETCNNEYGNYLFSFDSTQYSDGKHKMGVRMTNEDGYDFTSWYDVYINNSGSDAPEFTVDTVSENAILTGDVCAIGGRVIKGGTYPGLKLYVDDVLVSETCNNEYGNYLFVFDSTKYENGNHKIGIRLYNEDGYDHTSTYNVTINNTNLYTITYDLDGGTLPQNNPEKYSLGQSFILYNPIKQGFDFAGWTGTGINNPQDYVEVSASTSGNLSFSAHWKAKNEQRELNSQVVIYLKPNEQTVVDAVVSPKTGTDSDTVTWKSSNTSVATVKNGVVTAVSVGEAVITAYSENGTETGAFKVVVDEDVVQVESVRFNKNSTTIEIGSRETLSATVLPDNASNKNLVWTSSNSNIVTVTNGKVKALNVGNATVYARTQSGEEAAKIDVRVVSNIVEIISIKLDQTSLTMSTNARAALKLTVNPTNASNKEVVWKSSSSAVSVDDGNLTAKHEGDAIITATTLDGEHSVSCNVTVKNASNVQDGTGDRGDQSYVGQYPTETGSQSKFGNKTLFKSSTNLYNVLTGSTGQVAFCGLNNKNQISVKIPSLVIADGSSYEVTEVSAKAIKGNQKVKSLVVGSSVRIIGKKACAKCRELRKVTIAGGNIEKIEESAFAGCKKLSLIQIDATKKSGEECI